MMFSIVKGRRSRIRKSAKKNSNDILSGAFRPLESSGSDDATLSGGSSECSTLVDFVIHGPEVESTLLQEELDPSGILLEYDNQAWSSGVAGPDVPYSQSASREACCTGSQLSLLDEDECTWVMPRRSKTPKCCSSTTLFGKRFKSTKKTSAPFPLSDLLEPEERSWV